MEHEFDTQTFLWHEEESLNMTALSDSEILANFRLSNIALANMLIQHTMTAAEKRQLAYLDIRTENYGREMTGRHKHRSKQSGYIHPSEMP
jgi:hypothetical protein